MIALIVGWLVCSALSYAITLAHLQRSFPQLSYEFRRGDVLSALAVSILGPLSLVAMFCHCGFARHGLLWRPLSYEVYEQAHRRSYPNLQPQPR